MGMLTFALERQREAEAKAKAAKAAEEKVEEPKVTEAPADTKVEEKVEEPKEETKVEEKVETKPKKPKVSPNTAEYNDAMFMVTTYTDNSDLKKELIKLVNMKKDMASKERYRFYASTIKNYLDCLDETFGDDEVLKIEAVKLSIRYNGTTKIMIPNNVSNNKCVDNVQSEHKKDYKPALDENGNPIVF